MKDDENKRASAPQPCGCRARCWLQFQTWMSRGRGVCFRSALTLQRTLLSTAQVQ